MKYINVRFEQNNIIIESFHENIMIEFNNKICDEYITGNFVKIPMKYFCHYANKLCIKPACYYHKKSCLKTMNKHLVFNKALFHYCVETGSNDDWIKLNNLINNDVYNILNRININNFSSIISIEHQDQDTVIISSNIDDIELCPDELSPRNILLCSSRNNSITCKKGSIGSIVLKSKIKPIYHNSQSLINVDNTRKNPYSISFYEIFKQLEDVSCKEIENNLNKELKMMFGI